MHDDKDENEVWAGNTQTPSKNTKYRERVEKVGGLLLIFFSINMDLGRKKEGWLNYSVNPFSVFMIHFVCVRACVRVCMLFFLSHFHTLAYIFRKGYATERTTFSQQFFAFYFLNSFCGFHTFFFDEREREIKKKKYVRKRKGRNWNCNWNAPLITLSPSKHTHTKKNRWKSPTSDYASSANFIH